MDVNFGVTKEMAERALRVLEWYCNDTAQVVVPRIRTDGTTELYLTANTGPTVCPCCHSLIGHIHKPVAICAYYINGRCVRGKDTDPCCGFSECTCYHPEPTF